MPIFKRLWQRVFVYSVVLVVVAGATGVYLLRDNLEAKASSAVTAFTVELRNALKGLDAKEAGQLLERFNNREAKFWLEDKQGNLIAGKQFADRPGKDWSGHLRTVNHAGDLALWRTDLDEPLFLAIVPCKLRGRNATLYAAFMPFPAPPLETLLSPGIITLLLITGLLALWIALRVGGPLRRLREEVSQVSGSPAQLEHVTVTGFDEVADVASAINRLVDSLKIHIESMNMIVVNASHELRSPLTRIGFSVDLIGEGLALCARHEKELSEQDSATLKLAETNYAALCRELDYINRLIGDTLFAGALEVRERSELTTVMSLSKVCASSAERFAPVFGRADVRFIWRVEPGLAVLGDETLLTQVLSNLLDNSAKYASGPEPQTWLQLTKENGRALLSVENTHAPLPPEAMEHLFDPYFRYKQPIGTGVGLGLPIVQKIVLLHDGQISADNTNRGLRFRVSLPLRVKPVPRPS